MEIVFDYRPVELITKFTVNGIIRSDLFGELGAVSRYPLQSWLWKRGPWMGLKKVLQDIARDRPMDITFIGREIDLRDFEQAVNGIEKTALYFQRAYEETSACQVQTDRFSRYIESYPDSSVREKASQLLRRKRTELVYRLETAERYREAERRIWTDRLVLLLPVEVFRTVQKDLVEMLYENFMRPSESIVVLARNPQEKAMLREEMGSIGISVAEEEDELIGDLIKKYSVPEIVSADEGICSKLTTLLDSLSQRYESAKDENRKIRLRLRQETVADDEADQLDRCYNKNLEEIRWFDAHKLEIEEDLADLNGVVRER